MGVADFFSEFKSKYFWRAVLIELVATITFVFLTTAAHTHVTANERFMLLIKSSLATGFSAAVLVKIFAPLSGAHFNPAVSFGAYINGDISSPRSSLYSGVQYIGGILGAGLTWLLTPSASRASLGVGSFNAGVSVAQGFLMECLLTFVLMLCVLRCNDKKSRSNDGPPAIIIGFAYLALHLIGLDYTGGIVNPARAFGASLVTNNWPNNSWVYWVAPYVGSGFAGVLYRFGFKSSEEIDGVIKEQIELEAQINRVAP